MEKVALTSGLVLFIGLAAIGQEMDYQVGFKVISTYDSCRTYRPNTPKTDKLHYRPVDIDLWYPAYITSSDTTVLFADLVHLLEERSNFYGDTRTYDGLTDEMLQYICAGSDCLDYEKLKKVSTKSYLNAKPVERQFPLIIYFAGLNGMSYENYLLFESLTRRGFVVASVSSIGRYPGNMTMDLEDVIEQIKDAEFVIDQLTKKDLTSRNVGLIGYSWGGLAATIMAMKERGGIKAIVSLDGSEQFSYLDGLENEKIRRIREASFFKPQEIRSSFLYLDSDVSELANLPDSIYNITDHILSEKCYLKIDKSTHEDFSSLSIVSGEYRGETRYSVIQALTFDYLVDKLKGEWNFFKNIPNDGITRQFS